MPSEQPGPEHWRDFGRVVFRTRMDKGFATQRELAAVAGVHWNTVRRLEAGVLAKRPQPSWLKVEKALGWEAGAIERAWRGGPGKPEIEPAAADDLAAAVTRVLIDVAPELTGGQIRDIARGVEQIALERGWVVAEG
jgi:hypothetical protein